MDNPLYIVAPRYTSTSAGVQVLYMLCAKLRSLGYDSYIYQRPFFSIYVPMFIKKNIRFLTADIRDHHFKKKLTPIVIYPETFSIKKFNAPIKVKYYLHYKNHLKKNLEDIQEDYCLTYSKNIEKKISFKNKKTIFFPISDPNFFIPKLNVKRSGCVYYAGKFKYLFNGDTSDITQNMTEITRDNLNSQTKDEIRQLFQASEYFYCFEDSALAIESILCGCPVIFIPNNYFKECLGAQELNGYGYSWGTNPIDIAYAKSTVHLGRNNYFLLLKKTDRDVEDFAKEIQKLAQKRKYISPFAKNRVVKEFKSNVLTRYSRLCKDYIEDNGFKIFLSLVIKRCRHGRFKI